MKYALRYYSTSKKLDQVDELIIKYKEYTPALIEFLDNRPKGQKIVIRCYNYEITEEDVELVRQAAVRNNTNVVLELPFITSEEIIDYIKAETTIPFFFDTYITSEGMLYDIIERGVSEVKLMGGICFNLKNVSAYCHEKDVKVRVHPNLAQSDGLDPHGMVDFFLRPEDLDYYEDYIDTLEFYCPLDKQDVLYEIYRDGRWQGYLDELIMNFKEDKPVNNMNIMPDFGKYRASCNRRCLLSDKCNYCNISRSLAGTLAEKSIYITRKKKEYEYNANETSVSNEHAESV